MIQLVHRRAQAVTDRYHGLMRHYGLEPRNAGRQKRLLEELPLLRAVEVAMATQHQGLIHGADETVVALLDVAIFVRAVGIGLAPGLRRNQSMIWRYWMTLSPIRRLCTE